MLLPTKLNRFNSFRLTILFLSGILLSGSAVNAMEYYWFNKSGIWETQELESGNKVIRQTYKHDRKKTKSPTPYLMFRTLQLQPEEKGFKILNVSKIKFLLNVDSFYSKDGTGEAAVFLTGSNEKDLYYIQFLFNKRWFYRVSLFKSEIIDPKRPMKAFGNFRVKELAYTEINFPAVCRKEIFIKIKPEGVQLFLNDRLVLSYFNTPKTKWIDYPESFLAIGSRGASAWIDNVEVYEFKNNIIRMIFRDDFSSPRIKRFVFRKAKKTKK